MGKNENFILINAVIFSAAFGFLEAAVVVYLRELWYPQGFAFPIKIISGGIITAEYLREAATLIMIFSAACIAGKTKLQRFAYFMLIFGVWDIVFYLALKIMLGWPASIMEYDLLFLLPAPWTGPVLAPVIISASMITAGIIIIKFINSGITFYQTKIIWLLEITGGTIVFLSFTASAGDITKGVYPSHFSWIVFSAGWLLSLMTFIYSFYRTIASEIK
ncbi:MAG TPA: hypothetical protein PLB12_11345 [Candidatus Goldiibacteriota bacterium]|nr:hypothetical protein [Candidatus Goldiibacteriota bacterium]HPI03450.1 hypothetical protein [Candidatus Goldiibacteriota bacterium]HPN64946.1 hypothetical protein [Candidatus Goldiibacteriota bacterium]HRQ44929.1 hypothetical protein [Candidatus Goldiibacteriota bacterium]